MNEEPKTRGEAAPGRKNRILVVDDDVHFLRPLVKTLEEMTDDLSVLTSESGREALALLATNQVDLLLTDLKMPGMDGFQLLSQAQKEFPTVPVIVMTAYGNPEVAGTVESMGALQYIEKPLSVEVLIEKIHRGLAAKSEGFSQSVLSLPALLKLIENQKKTCTLTVRSKEKNGSFYFVDGLPVGCKTPDRNGDEAVWEILTWQNPLITIFNTCHMNPGDPMTPISKFLKTLTRKKGKKGAKPKKRRKTTAVKETTMNVKKIQEIVTLTKEDVGEALIATDIWAVADGQSIAAHNPQPKASALFNRITIYLQKALSDAEFPAMESYYYMNLSDNIVALVLLLGDYQQGMLVNTKEFQIGLLLNVTIPKILRTFEEAMQN